MQRRPEGQDDNWYINIFHVPKASGAWLEAYPDAEYKTISDVQNPHDKLFRETWSNLENARSFLQYYLPDPFSIMDDITTENIKDIVEQALSKKEGSDKNRRFL